MAQWDLDQYEKFKAQRSQPFWDLANLVQPGAKTMIDLGCGSGELTSLLHQKLSLSKTLGMDSSKEMLAKADAFTKPGVTFEVADINSFKPREKVDLVFSNAALQWVPDHPKLFAHIKTFLNPNGQLAVQMPCNFDHLSHQLAEHLAQTRFKNRMLEDSREIPVLKPEQYADLLYSLGFSEPKVRMYIYPHPMQSGLEVVEWVKGTFLTDYKKKMKPEDFEEFLKEYTRELIQKIGSGPYLYCYKRILLWGQLH